MDKTAGQVKHAPATPLPLRLVKRSNQIGVRELWIDAAADGCFRSCERPILGVDERVVARAEEIVKRDTAYQKLVEALRSMEQWARDLSEQSDANTLDGLERLRRGHCPQYNKTCAILRSLGEDA